MTAVYTLGIMTGNSLDATDVVLTSFEEDNISDIAAYSKAYPKSLTQKMLALRQKINAVNADMSKLEQDEEVISAINEYTMEVAQTVNEFLQQTDFPKEKIAAIGFHGQTCDHFPPSIAQGKAPYTIQVGNAQMLADLTKIPVIYDFRSDDIMNGGEGAPLAPVHNQHLAKALQQKGVFPVAFAMPATRVTLQSYPRIIKAKVLSKVGIRGLSIIIRTIFSANTKTCLMTKTEFGQQKGRLFRSC